MTYTLPIWITGMTKVVGDKVMISASTIGAAVSFAVPQEEAKDMFVGQGVVVSLKFDDTKDDI